MAAVGDRGRLAALVAVLALAACGGDDPTQTPLPPQSVVTTVTVSPATAMLDSVGAQITLVATCLDQNGATMSGVSVSWASSDPSVASVDGQGVVTAVTQGSTSITASSGNVTSAPVTVTVDVGLTAHIRPDPITLVAQDHTVRVWAWAVDAEGNYVPGESVTWDVADPGVVHLVVDQWDNAHLTPVRDGVTTLRAVVDGAVASSTVTVSLELRVEWVVRSGADVMASAAIADDGTIYWGSLDGHLYALNPDGTSKWAYPADGWVFASAAIGADGTVHGTGGWAFSSAPPAAGRAARAAADEGVLFALTPGGELKWEVVIGGELWSSPALADDGTVYVGTTDGALWAVGQDGTPKWSVPLSGAVVASPAVGSDQTVYIGSSGGWLHAIDPDGTQKWALELGGYTSPAAIAEDGTIYVGSTGGTPGLHAVDPDGSLLWTFPAERGVTSSPAIGVDGTVYVGSRSGVLLALDPDGTERWRFPLVGGSGNPTGGNGTSPAVGDDGTVYVGSNNGYLYAVAADGTLRWSLYLGDEVFTPPAIGPNGWIYVGDEDSRFWALSYLTGGSTGLADSAWPKFRHDAWNTGNVSSR